MHDPQFLEPRLPFIALEPPPGGLSRLQQSVRRRHNETRPFHAGAGWRWAGAGALAAGALLAVLTLPATWNQHRQLQALALAVQQAMTTGSSEHITVTDGAALALPGHQEDVRVYLVQTTLEGTSGRSRPPNTAR